MLCPTTIEKIAGFFEELDIYLHRLKVVEEHLPRLPEIESVLIKRVKGDRNATLWCSGIRRHPSEFYRSSLQ